MSIEQRILDLSDSHDCSQRRALRAIALDARKMEDRIKRLEEAGDAILKAFSKDPDKMCFDDWVVMTTDTRTNWRKAKEAKP